MPTKSTNKIPKLAFLAACSIISNPDQINQKILTELQIPNNLQKFFSLVNSLKLKKSSSKSINSSVDQFLTINQSNLIKLLLNAKQKSLTIGWSNQNHPDKFNRTHEISVKFQLIKKLFESKIDHQKREEEYYFLKINFNCSRFREVMQILRIEKNSSFDGKRRIHET